VGEQQVLNCVENGSRAVCAARGRIGKARKCNTTDRRLSIFLYAGRASGPQPKSGRDARSPRMKPKVAGPEKGNRSRVELLESQGFSRVENLIFHPKTPSLRARTLE